MASPEDRNILTNEKTQLDKLLDYAESAMADGYPYEVIDGDLALTVKALRAFKASQNEPKASQIEPRVFRGNGPNCLGCGKTLPEHLTGYNFCPGLPSDDRPAVNRRGEPT